MSLTEARHSNIIGLCRSQRHGTATSQACVTHRGTAQQHHRPVSLTEARHSNITGLCHSQRHGTATSQACVTHRGTAQQHHRPVSLTEAPHSNIMGHSEGRTRSPRLKACGAAHERAPRGSRHAFAAPDKAQLACAIRTPGVQVEDTQGLVRSAGFPSILLPPPLRHKTPARAA